MNHSKCQYPRCSDLSDLVYLGKALCDKHWIKICDMDTEKAHKILGIKLGELAINQENFVPISLDEVQSK